MYLTRPTSEPVGLILIKCSRALASTRKMSVSEGCGGRCEQAALAAQGEGGLMAGTLVDKLHWDAWSSLRTMNS